MVNDSEGNFSSVNFVWGDGNGGQTITLSDSSFTPIRSQGASGLDTNVISKAVAYDYDYSESGYANAWDSPFDFAYKMYQQKLSMVTHFKSITDADQTAATKDAEFPNGKDPSGSIAWEVNAAGTEIKVTNGNLNSWSSNTEAPMHFWKFYWKEASDGHQPYIPGLGLYEHDTHVDGNLNNARQKGTGHEKNLWISDNPLDPAIKFNAKKSAGTDCLGFVERSASYRNTSEARNKKRIYTWQTNSMMPVDMAEAEGHNLNETTLRCNNNLVYPYNKTDHQGRTDCENSTLIVSRKLISDMDDGELGLDFFSTDTKNSQKAGYNGPSLDEFNSLKNKFLSIVPGDVIFYGKVEDGLYTGSHIGEIANVDYTMIRNATTINQLLQSVTVIECVYNGSVNYVIKRNMFAFGDEVDPLTVTTDTAGSWKFQTKNWQDPFKIEHLRAWEIRRLNSK